MIYHILVGIVVSYACALLLQRFLPLKTLQQVKKMALVIAHPDDEVMFFAPAILHLLNVINPKHFFVVCITKGGHDGSPAVREKELLASCHTLGILQKNIVFLEDPRFLDHPSRSWNEVELSMELASLLHAREIDNILTFGSGGVSGHINHKDTHKAVMLLKTQRKFVLADVNLFRKYSSVIDVVFTFLIEGLLFQKPVFVSGPRDVYKAFKAMQCHDSQFVWFRKLYFMFSRYVIVNNCYVIEPSEH